MTEFSYIVNFPRQREKSILELNKYLDKRIIVKLDGGREGSLFII